MRSPRLALAAALAAVAAGARMRRQSPPNGTATPTTRTSAKAQAAAIAPRLVFAADDNPYWPAALLMALIRDGQPDARALYIFLSRGGMAWVERRARVLARRTGRTFPGPNPQADAAWALRAWATSKDDPS